LLKFVKCLTNLIIVALKTTEMNYSETLYLSGQFGFATTPQGTPEIDSHKKLTAR
jgi:hypothetical protein